MKEQVTSMEKAGKVDNNVKIMKTLETDNVDGGQEKGEWLT